MFLPKKKKESTLLYLLSQHPNTVGDHFVVTENIC